MEHGLMYKGKEVELSQNEMLAVMMCVTFVDAAFTGRVTVMDLMGTKLSEQQTPLKVANLRMMVGFMGEMVEAQREAGESAAEFMKRVMAK